MNDLTNEEVAHVMEELGDLYELDGADRYRVIAYRTAAKTIRQTPLSIVALARVGRATELPGIGSTLQDKICMLADTGSVPSLDRLKAKYPEGLIDIMHLQGFGAKSTRKLFDELGIASIDALRKACETHQIRGLRGFGSKVEDRLLELVGTDGAAKPTGREKPRMLLSLALMVGEQVIGELRELESVQQVALAGSLRRKAETVKDIDIVIASSDPVGLSKALPKLAFVQSVQGGGEASSRIITFSGLPVDLKVVKDNQFGNALQHFTGSQEHNVALREEAVRRGLHISEYGILDEKTGTTNSYATEEEVYEHLGYAWIPPELRENRGELAAARKSPNKTRSSSKRNTGKSGKTSAKTNSTLPNLITLADIRGDLHCHTVASDGHKTVEQMAYAAIKKGYEYIAFTDHSATHGFGNDVSPDELKHQIEHVRQANDRIDGIELLIGTETNILPNGLPDYDDDLLEQLDWVIGSIHTSFAIGARAMTDRIISAIEHPWIDAIGHLTGRKILRRQPYPLEIERIFAAAAKTGTMIEINASPDRRDLNEVNARLARDSGVMIVINSDAHSSSNLDLLRYGIATARRGWLTAADVANTRSWKEFAPLRKRALSKTQTRN